MCEIKDGYEKTLTGRDAEKFGQQFLETLPVGADAQLSLMRTKTISVVFPVLKHGASHKQTVAKIKALR